MKNVYTVEMVGEEIFAAGDHEFIFVYRTQDLEIERMIRTENSKIWCLGHIKLADESQVMYSVGDNGLVQIWSEEILLKEPQIQLFDDELIGKLGTESMSLVAKSLTFHHGAEGVESYFVIGFEQNIIVYYKLSGFNVSCAYHLLDRSL